MSDKAEQPSSSFQKIFHGFQAILKSNFSSEVQAKPDFTLSEEEKKNLTKLYQYYVAKEAQVSRPSSRVGLDTPTASSKGGNSSDPVITPQSVSYPLTGKRQRPSAGRDSPGNITSSWETLGGISKLEVDATLAPYIRSTDKDPFEIFANQTFQPRALEHQAFPQAITNAYLAIAQQPQLNAQGRVCYLFGLMLLGFATLDTWGQTVTSSNKAAEEVSQTLTVNGHNGISTEDIQNMFSDGVKLFLFCSRNSNAAVVLLQEILTEKKFIKKPMTIQGESYRKAMKRLNELDFDNQADETGAKGFGNTVMNSLRVLTKTWTRQPEDSMSLEK